MLIAIRKSKKKINIFNLGCNEYLNVRTSAKLICKKLKIKPKFIFTGGKRGWVGDQPFVFLNTKKIRNLKWKNKINIQNSIIDTVDWLDSDGIECTREELKKEIKKSLDKWTKLLQITIR